jgi:two-component system sensor histidine kinase KdpD
VRKDVGVAQNVSADVDGSLSALPDTAAVGALPRTRRLSGIALAVLLPVALTTTLVRAGDVVGVAGDALALLIAVIVTALVGGQWSAVLCALLGSSLLNYWFIPPVRTFQIGEARNIWTVVGFLVVGLLVSGVVHRAASTASAAARAAAEARTLSDVARATLRGEDALPTLLEHMRRAFGMTSASVLRRHADAVSDTGSDLMPGWAVVVARGPDAPQSPAEADIQMPAGQGLVLTLSGRSLGASDRAILEAFAAQVQALLERDDLARSAAQAARLEASEKLRDALLAALGHDLRTPLAAATAAVTSLRSSDVTWTEPEREELLATAEESLARLGSLVSDLLDLSRLRAGVLNVSRQTLWLDELLAPALDELGTNASDVVVDLPDALPPVVADAGLLMRVLVNVLGNALHHGSSEAAPPVVTGRVADHGVDRDGERNRDRVELLVIDHGPGVEAQEQERMFRPFQRLGDTDNTTGLGIGLALSRGLIEAMAGTITPQPTPGGGLTMVLSLPRADHADDADGAYGADRADGADGTDGTAPPDEGRP